MSTTNWNFFLKRRYSRYFSNNWIKEEHCKIKKKRNALINDHAKIPEIILTFPKFLLLDNTVRYSQLDVSLKIGNRNGFDSCASSKFPRIRFYLLVTGTRSQTVPCNRALSRLEIHLVGTHVNRKRAYTCVAASLKVFRKNGETYQKYVQPYCVSWKRCCSCTLNFDLR